MLVQIGLGCSGLCETRETNALKETLFLVETRTEGEQSERDEEGQVENRDVGSP